MDNSEKNSYNTDNENIILREYGRNIQMLVNHIKTIENKEKRTQQAYTLIELMRQLKPNTKDTSTADIYTRLWDDLFIIADFDLDIDSPFPPPIKEVLGQKPNNVPYSNNAIKFRHYGKNIEFLVKRATEVTEEETRFAVVVHVARLMKSFYTNWNKETLENNTILEHLQELSRNKIENHIIERIKAENWLDIEIEEESSVATNIQNNTGGGANFNTINPANNNKNKNKNKNFKYNKNNNNNNNNRKNFSNNNNNNNRKNNGNNNHNNGNNNNNFKKKY
ncbi:MAG: DUF4290 domain-containing protein [Cytophagales bacterium]|nr:MAG: DUF4290 domain-containing protein [Cytophagales bacterium]